VVNDLSIVTAEGPVRALPLSAAQLGVWVAQNMDQANPRYLCGAYLDVAGAVDVALMEAAVRRALGETEALRVRFVELDGRPYQLVVQPPATPLRVVDLRSEPDPSTVAEESMRARLRTPMDLDAAPLFDHALYRLAGDRSLFFLAYHHVVMDGYGQYLYWRRVGEVYGALAEGRDPGPGPGGGLAELLDEDAAYRASPEHDVDREFWLRRFADPPPVPSLAARSTAVPRSLRRRAARLPAGAGDALRAGARRLGTRWSVLVIAAAAAYVHRLTGAGEVVLGLPVTARVTPVARSTPGMLANELPLRVAIRPDLPVRELVRRVTREVGDALRHQRYRGEDLQEAVRLAAGEASPGTPVVNVVSFDQPIRFGGFATAPHYLSSGPVRDLSIDAYGRSDGSDLQVQFDADPERYASDDLASHHSRFLRFVERLASAEPDAPVGRVELLPPDERRRLIAAAGATERPYDLSRCLHELVLEQAERTPDATAAATADGSLTYRELAARSGRLAAHLRRLGAGPGQRVGVHDVRSLELVVELLAILRTGAAYVPLDPELPPARLALLVEDAGIRLAVSRSTHLDGLAGLDLEAVPVDAWLPGSAPAGPLPRLAAPASPAYVLYTSGSTGRPKGVVVPHRGVVNRLLWMQEELRLGPDDVVLQKTPFTFDVSVWELFWPLLTGSRLFLAEPGAHRDPRALARAVRDRGVTTVHFVPPMLDHFLAEPEAGGAPRLRRVVCSGEALRPETVRAFFERFDRGVELLNLYGPTEASVDVTWWRCRPEDARGPVPIGRPVANTAVYLLDPGAELVPAGVPGELCIGGVQVATGYLGRPDLTAERFVPDPFQGGTMYRTGDLARLRADGAVEFLGRLDDQVKVRGFRIEPGEVEAALRAHPAVRQALVRTWDRAPGDRRLVAYVAARPAPDAGELTRFLAGRLPEYLVPAHVVVLDRLPLLPNGKVDRRALPEPAAGPAAGGGAPATAEERLLHEVWTGVLGVEGAGVEDSFFALGGDSMLAIRARAETERRGSSFAVQDLLRYPTIRALAPRLRPLDGAGRRDGRTGPFALLAPEDRGRLPAGVEDAYPVGAMQAGMLFHAGYDDAETSVYRVVTSIRVEAPFDEACLRRSVARTVRRHPALRTSFDLSSFSEPLQLVHREVSVPVAVERDLLGLDEEARRRAIAAWVDAAKFRRFDPGRPPLLAFTAHPCTAGAFQLSVVEHHAIVDGWSDAAMLAEVVDRYRAALAGEELWLPEVPSTYRDFVAEERRAAGDEASRRYWRGLLEGVDPAPLPRRSAAGPGPARHREVEVPVPASLAGGLRLAARRLGLPLKALLAASHVAVLRLVTGAGEVLTGAIANGRLEEEGGDAVVGVFLNTLPLRVDAAHRSLAAIAAEVFAQEVAAAPHRRYPFAQMQRELDDLRLDSYVNVMDFHRALDGVGVAETNLPLAVDFLVDPADGGLRLTLVCDVSVLDEDLCERLGGCYRRALEAAAAAPEAPVADLDLIGPDERRRVAGWNATDVPFERSATVHELVRRQAGRTPDAVAVAAHGAEPLTYAALAARTAQFANHLRALGVARGSRVGVRMGRGPDLVVALLAVMEAGGAYVPLDPGFPSGRLEYIAGDAGLHGVVEEVAAGGPPAPPASGAGAGDAAYVMYTSGSSGRPKGTVVRHRNVVNFFAGMDERVGCGAGDVLLAVTSVSFDISVLELLWPLTRGATVVLSGERPVERLVDGDDSLAALCRRHRVTMLQGTPSFLAAVASEPAALEALAGARAVLVGGEPFPAGLAQRLVRALPGVRLCNMYGPTETTIWSTVHELDPERDVDGGPIPIGRPIANTRALVLDATGRPAPVGVAGELWLAGEGVAAGYLGQPAQTAERFVPLEPGGEPAYRTGDRARWRADGRLEFLGRLDRQVKILGHRVEPDEVESLLSRHPLVAAVAVVAAARERRAPELVAYVAPGRGLVDAAAEDAHVRSWVEVWDDAYAAPEGGEFAGWVSSYTGEPIPTAEMREWLRHTVDRVAALRPRAILDVGAGAGLLLGELAPRVERYLGFDVSEAAVRRAAASPAARSPHVELRAGDAGRLAELEPGSWDTVVLNSVVQYFPTAGYLERALGHAVRVAGPGGAVFVGDVRDLGLLAAFHAGVVLRRARALAGAPELARAVAQRVADERELCLAPAFFRSALARLDAGVLVEVEVKRGPAVNELTRFRYDVTLRGPERPRPAAPEAVAWRALGSVDAAADRLRGTPGGLAVTGVPNRRLAAPLALLRLLDEAAPEATAWDLERRLWEVDEDGAVDPEDLAAVGDRAGRRARLLVPGHGRLDEVDVVFEPAR
jgi:amino acid adenylation domain-containing protein